MSPYRVLTFNHANLKRPVHIVVGTIAGYHWSDKAAAVCVYTTGGVFPVLESEEEIKTMIQQTAAEPQGEKHVPTTVHTTRNVRKR